MDCDYTDFVKQLTNNINKASEALKQQSKRIKEDTIQLMKKRSQLKAEGKTDEVYQNLCKDIRKKVKEDYEDYRKKRLREAAAKKKSLKAVERDIRLKRQIPVALKDEKGNRTTKRREVRDICYRF